MRVSVNGEKQVLAHVRKYQFRKLQQIKDVVRDTAHNVERDAKKKVAVDTGHLRSSIGVAPTGEFSMKIGTNVDYAPHVEFGTAPHKITPNKKKALAFKAGGEQVIVKSVQHPGTRAQPFLFPAAELNRAGFILALRRRGIK